MENLSSQNAENLSSHNVEDLGTTLSSGVVPHWSCSTSGEKWDENNSNNKLKIECYCYAMQKDHAMKNDTELRIIIIADHSMES